MSADTLATTIATLEEENETLLSFLYVAPVGLVQVDGAGFVSIMNPLAVQLLMSLAGPAGVSNLFDALSSYAPDLRHDIASFVGERGTIVDGCRIHVGAIGAREAVILACSLIQIEPGRIMAVLTDITEQVAQERRLKEAESWFSTILSGVKDFALLSLNAKGRVTTWNESGQRLTGHPAEDILGHTMNVFYPPDEAIQGRALQQVDLAGRNGWHIDEGWRRRKDGSRFWCQSLVSALEEASGTISGFSVVLRDVTEQKANGDEIRRLLTTDHLTGLLNRARFFELAEAEIVRWARFGKPLSALMIDIDHFKAVNDRYGHGGGDTILCEIARHFTRTLRSIDVVGRLGGEEFAILLPSIDAAGAKAIAELLCCGVQALGPSVDGVPVPVTVSIGCAGLGGPVQSIDDLLKAADAALYVAKNTGRNRVVVDRSGGQETMRAA